MNTALEIVGGLLVLAGVAGSGWLGVTHLRKDRFGSGGFALGSLSLLIAIAAAVYFAYRILD